MTPEQFCYWLQGYFELNGGRPLVAAEQSQMIQDHLALVFKKVTPDRKPGAQKLLTEEQVRKAFGEPAITVDPYSQPDVYCCTTGTAGRIC